MGRIGFVTVFAVTVGILGWQQIQATIARGAHDGHRMRVELDVDVLAGRALAEAGEPQRLWNEVHIERAHITTGG